MRFLVVGDDILDIYWSGSIRRLNPERHAAPLVVIERKAACPGGAGNVVQNLMALGVLTSHIFGNGQSQKNRVVDEDGVVCRFDVDVMSEPLTQVTGPLVIDAIIISDYGKGTVTAKLAEILRPLRIPTFVDTKADPSPWTWATCLFPNSAEYHKYKREYGEAKLCFLKLGKQGAIFLRSGVRSESFSAVRGPVVNTCGAGDTVIASFAVAYMATKISKECPDTCEYAAGRFSMGMASLAVASMYTCSPTLNEWESVHDTHCPTMSWLEEKIRKMVAA